MSPEFSSRSAPCLALAAAIWVGAAPATASATDLRGGIFDRAWSLSVGAALAVRPTYEGSDEYEAVGVPIVAPRFSDAGQERSRISFRGLDDIRLRLVDQHGFEAGPLAGYEFGRDESDGDLLNGLGDIDGGLIVGGFAGYRFDRFLFDVAYLQNVTGADDTGFQIRFAAQTDLDLTEHTTLKLIAGTTYASEDYTNTYFGISAAQSAASGLATFDPEAGFKDVYVGASAKTELTDRITLNIGGRYQRLIGDAADSPVVASENQFHGTVGLSYRFDFGSR